MRPVHERLSQSQDIEDDEDLDEDPEIDPGQEDQPSNVLKEKMDHAVPYHPVLQIRRDLQNKPSTVTSGVLEPCYLGPFRKRHLDSDRPIYMERQTPPLPMNLRMSSHILGQSVQIAPPTNILKPPDCTPGCSKSNGDKSPSNFPSDLSMKKQEPPKPPPKKTGFTIDEIMKK